MESGSGEHVGVDERMLDQLKAKLGEWSHDAIDSVQAASRAVRTAEDAAAMVRLGYVSVFAAVKQSEWVEWDALSRLIPTAWDEVTRAGELIDHVRSLGGKLDELASRFDKVPPAPGLIGNLAWGLLVIGMLALAIARRTEELIAAERARLEARKAAKAATEGAAV